MQPQVRGRLWSVALAALFLSQTQCARSGGGPRTAGGNGVKALGAAAATFVAVAAVRAVTKSCYAVCQYGTVCNHRTGFCVAVNPDQKDQHCVDDQGNDQCGNKELAVPPDPPDSSAEPDDPCAGMCLSGERCVIKRGNLSCEPQ